ncbi:MAG: SixA phosphatase family protein, partial [Actinocrinis sp.]
RLDRVVCSPARRTRETWELAAAQLDSAPEPVYDDRMYAASGATLLTVLRETPENVRGLVVVGHNPAMHDLALGLADESSDSATLARLRQKYPTSAIAHFIVETAWSKLAPGRVTLAEFVIPRGDGSENGD